MVVSLLHAFCSEAGDEVVWSSLGVGVLWCWFVIDGGLGVAMGAAVLVAVFTRHVDAVVAFCFSGCRVRWESVCLSRFRVCWGEVGV